MGMPNHMPSTSPRPSRVARSARARACGTKTGESVLPRVAWAERGGYNTAMRHYERYLLLHLLWPAVLIALSLTGIVWLTQVLRFLDFILNRGLSLGDFLYLTGLMLPSLILMLLPISLGIAVIYTYNKLTIESELVVFNAVGISKWQQAKPAVALGISCVVICYALSLYIMPMANQRFRDMRSLFRDKYASILLEEEVFNSPMDGLTVFVRERDSNNNLGGILLHDSRDPKQTITMIAQTGRVEQTASGPKFYLQHGLRQQLKDGRISWLAFEDYALEIAFYGKNDARNISPDEQTISGLYNREGLTEKQVGAYRAEAHQRLTWPLFALALPLFALATLFSTEFSRRGQSKRMIFASIGMALLVGLYFALRNMIAKNTAVVPVLYLFVIAVIFASLYVLVTARIVRLPGRPMPVAQGA